MTGKVLFVQGGGENAHAWDSRLVASLEEKLGPGFAVRYPQMPNESDPNYRAWKDCICKELSTLGDDVLLVGHSIGAAILIKLLAEGGAGRSVRGIFLIAAPFLHDREGWAWKEAKLPIDPAEKLPDEAPLLLYHGREDEVVPFSHLALYARTFPRAIVRALEGRNHQLNDDLTEVASDITRIRK